MKAIDKAKAAKEKGKAYEGHEGKMSEKGAKKPMKKGGKKDGKMKKSMCGQAWALFRETDFSINGFE